MTLTIDSSPYLATSYARKAMPYFSGARVDFVDHLPSNPIAKILEVGCGDGTTGAIALQTGKCGIYVGVEMYEPAALQAKSRITTVHIGNVDTIDLPYQHGTFDALIMSEVLEHLVDPAATLHRLLPLLRPGALVMASSPNVAHWRVILSLYRGRFEYQPEGVMDYTHLRWFTPSSYRAMFEQLGLITERVEPIYWPSFWKRLIFRSLGAGRTHLGWGQINYFGRMTG